MKVLEKLAKAEFLESEKSVGCDTGLPPSCDCVCHTPCDFGKTEDSYSVGERDYGAKISEKEIYEIK
jgi:hypothetical protein